MIERSCSITWAPLSQRGFEMKAKDLMVQIHRACPTNKIGRENKIFQFASVGDIPQDKKYRNEPTRLEIGDRNVIREGCTINRGTIQDQSLTRIGNDNWIMAYVHLAHDCHVGNDTVFANNAQLAGHVHVGDFAILGGFTVVHQFVSIGDHSITAMGTILLQDLPPYYLEPAMPHPARVVPWLSLAVTGARLPQGMRRMETWDDVAKLVADYVAQNLDAITGAIRAEQAEGSMDDRDVPTDSPEDTAGRIDRFQKKYANVVKK